MDKKNLQNILSAPFTIPNWRDVLVSVFGAKRLHQNPIPIVINKKEKAEAAFELGSFNTSDDRIIGLYLVKVKPEVWIERNKVGLREMLRSVYKHDVDGALIVFEQKDKWRLSFVSEIRVFDENGKISKKTTEPKRYTYLLGAGEKVITPATRLASLSGKPFSFEDIRNAFSVEALNEEFYRVVAKYFYQLVGATEGKGEKAVTHPRILELPGIKPDNNEGHKIYQEFAVRLIGRTVFCWFLKVKKSDKGVALLAEHLLSSEAVASNNHYYHFILEKLFFQTLNTPMDERIKGLPKGCEQIPFLNGGLFEPQTEDYYKPNSSGLSGNLNTLVIPDSWFKDFFEHLEQYNFTIDENSVVDIEVSVDPEMLGRIFENLLAEIDPDSGETARKATGSFYTPREIVDYMATESLVHYLHIRTKIEMESLQPIFKMDSHVSFSKPETEKILEALDQLKILDPACGSGAFPIGVMQKIVMALQKLDKEAVWWKAKQIQRIENAILRRQVKQKLEQTTVEYARKIGIIQNSLYGVDIQPIAAEISKLRCFLTLVVDENIDETKPNRGVEPLPNLEFKFVTADALQKLPDEGNYGGLFNANEDIDLLQQIRLDYLQSYGSHKQELKDEFEKVRDRISKQQLMLGKNIDINSRAYKISTWNPFGHDKVDWFDPLWMYGVSGFDIVIGNPPYISHDKINAEQKKYYKIFYNSFEPFADVYCYFIERSLKVLNYQGLSCLITSNSFLKADYGRPLRNLIYNNNSILEIISIEDAQIFDSATVNTAILIAQNGKIVTPALVVKEIYDFKESFNQFISKSKFFYDQKDFDQKSWTLISPHDLQILMKIMGNHPTLESLNTKIRLGLATGDNDAFVINEQRKKEFEQLDPRNTEIIKPILRGRDIERYYHNLPEQFILLTKNGINVEKQYPTIYKYFDSLGDKFKKRGAKGQHWTNLRAVSFFDDFKEEKIIWIELTDIGRFALCSEEIYLLNSAYFLLPPKGYSTKYLLAILNSKLIKFFLEKTAETSGMGTSRWINNYVKDFPIPDPKNSKQFDTVVSYILAIIKHNSPINEYVPNNHLVQVFEEVIDALVYELYFVEDFKKAGISFMKYAERDFKSIEGKSEKEAIKIIHAAYQTLREKDNEIRQNLKLMDTRLADLIMPIKTAK
jgi:hypothetical protein